MKIKHVDSSYVFEADDVAAKDLIARGDYEKATKADEKVVEAVTETAPRSARKRTRRA